MGLCLSKAEAPVQAASGGGGGAADAPAASAAAPHLKGQPAGAGQAQGGLSSQAVQVAIDGSDSDAGAAAAAHRAAAAGGGGQPAPAAAAGAAAAGLPNGSIAPASAQPGLEAQQQQAVKQPLQQQPQAQPQQQPLPSLLQQQQPLQAQQQLLHQQAQSPPAGAHPGAAPMAGAPGDAGGRVPAVCEVKSAPMVLSAAQAREFGDAAQSGAVLPSQQQPAAATQPLQQQQPAQQQQAQQQPAQQPVQQPVQHQWTRTAGASTPPALVPAGGVSAKAASHPGGRSVKFACPPPVSEDGSVHDPRSRSCPGDGNGSDAGGGLPRARRSLPRRSASSSSVRSNTSNEVNEAVLAKQAEILRSNKAGKLRMRRGGLDNSFAAMQEALTQDEAPLDHVNTRAAGLKHIGFGPFKRENQDEFFIQVGDFGGVGGGNLFCVFDGHGSCGKDAALYSRQLLPRLLDVELRKYFLRVTQDSEAGLKGAVEVLITEVFGETERSLAKSGVNLASSGTTASVAFQRGNRLWVAAAGDSRAILCTRNARDQWRALPLTIDHRPRRASERERIEAAGARVAPKRLPSGRTVGEPRLWLQNAGGPGLLLSRSLGDLTAATVGCTSDPEVSFTTLRPNVDHVLVMATDGVWDVLTNEQVCDIVVESPDPHIACRRVLDAALYEWEERMSADNITVLVVEFEWGDDAAPPGSGDVPAAPVAATAAVAGAGAALHRPDAPAAAVV